MEDFFFITELVVNWCFTHKLSGSTKTLAQKGHFCSAEEIVMSCLTKFNCQEKGSLFSKNSTQVVTNRSLLLDILVGEDIWSIIFSKSKLPLFLDDSLVTPAADP